MKAISFIAIFLFSIVLLTSAFDFQVTSNIAGNSIRVCLDNSCQTGVSYTCNLLDSNNVIVKSCNLFSSGKTCCAVDSVPIWHTYHWQLIQNSTICYGNDFFYSGGDISTTFSCSNCEERK